MRRVGQITETVGGLNRNARALLPKYAFRPSDRMVPALGCDDCLLDQSHKLLARVKPRSAISPRSPGRSIIITSTLRPEPSTPVSTRPTPFLIPNQPKTRPVIPHPPLHPQSLGSPHSDTAAVKDLVSFAGR